MSDSESNEPQHGAAALEAARRVKLRKIQEMGIDPWGHRFDNHTAIGKIRIRESEIVAEPAAEPGKPPKLHGPKVRAAGRIVLLRRAGKLIFLDLHDWTGRIQVAIGMNQVGEKNWELTQQFDLGDLIGIDGELIRTKVGELTIFASDVHFLTKCIETPPEKHKGLTDPELRQRMRYLDLIHTDGQWERFLRRTKIVQSIRNTLAGEGFVEVEGPTLHAIAGGAAARPFTTHHNALDIDLFLRIALELHLKRLMVGGVERVYELGRVYRNEGIDARHNPEFTMLELYQAYGDYRAMMDLTEKLIVEAIGATRPAAEAAMGRQANRLHAALCAEDLRRVVPRTHRRGGRRRGGHRGPGQEDRLRDRQPPSRRGQERGLRGQGGRRPHGADFRDRLSGQHLPLDEAEGLEPGDRRTVRAFRPRHGTGQRLHGTERPGLAGAAFHASSLPGCRKKIRWPAWTATSSAPCGTACRPRAGWASASTGS